VVKTSGLLLSSLVVGFGRVDLVGYDFNVIRLHATARVIIIMLSLAAIGAFLGGCLTGQANLSDPTESALTWSLMEYDQRLAHMRNVVLPLAQEVFGAWRPEKLSRVDCSLCHGAGVDTGNFSMPSTNLIRRINQNQDTEFYIYKKDGKLQNKDSHGNDRYLRKGCFGPSAFKESWSV
jgi:hypothetical protein